MGSALDLFSLFFFVQQHPLLCGEAGPPPQMCVCLTPHDLQRVQRQCHHYITQVPPLHRRCATTTPHMCHHYTTQVPPLHHTGATTTPDRCHHYTTQMPPLHQTGATTKPHRCHHYTTQVPPLHQTGATTMPHTDQNGFTFTNGCAVLVILFYILFVLGLRPRGQWMDYRCTSGSLGNSSSAAGRSDPGETIGPSYSLAIGASFFRAPCTSLHIYSSPLISFL